MCEKRKSAKTNHRQCVCTVLWVHSMHSFIRMWISEHVCVWHYGMHIKLKFLRLNSRSIKNKRNDFNNNAHNSSYPLNEHMCTLVLCWQCLILLLLWTWFFFHTVQFEFKKCVSHSNSYTTRTWIPFEWFIASLSVFFFCFRSHCFWNWDGEKKQKRLERERKKRHWIWIGLVGFGVFCAVKGPPKYSNIQWFNQ